MYSNRLSKLMNFGDSRVGVALTFGYLQGGKETQKRASLSAHLPVPILSQGVLS